MGLKWQPRRSFNGAFRKAPVLQDLNVTLWELARQLCVLTLLLKVWHPWLHEKLGACWHTRHCSLVGPGNAAGMRLL